MANKELWDKCRAGNKLARDQLITDYMPLVNAIAAGVYKGLPNTVEIDDLISDGMLGLIDAVGKFDNSRGFKFETYATTRIRGSILDGLRKLDWVPRNERAAIREYLEAHETVERDLQRVATQKDIQEYLGWDDVEFYRVSSRASDLSGGVSTLVMQDDHDETFIDSVFTLGTPTSMIDIPGSSDNFDAIQGSLANAIDSLNVYEKTILGLRYYKGMKFFEMGEVLGVSESRVSQIHTKITEKIRAAMVD